MIAAALILSLALPSSAAPAAAPAECKAQKPEKHAKLTFASGKSITVDVVDTPMTREIGLMCVKKLPKDYGMLFVFSQPMGLNFWMKNTLVSLDIAWIDAFKKVTVVHDHMKKSRVDTPDSEVATAGGYGMYVLELPAGAAARHGLKAGDTLKFEVDKVEK